MEGLLSKIYSSLDLITKIKNLDQSWADHAVVYLYFDMIMNQWSNVFHLLLLLRSLGSHKDS